MVNRIRTNFMLPDLALKEQKCFPKSSQGVDHVVEGKEFSTPP